MRLINLTGGSLRLLYIQGKEFETVINLINVVINLRI